MAEPKDEQAEAKQAPVIMVQPMQFDKIHMERQANKVRQRVCAAGLVEVQEAGEAVNPRHPGSDKAPYYEIRVKDSNCQNLRRTGSKWCQECSDKYNNAGPTDQEDLEMLKTETENDEGNTK